MSPKPHETTIRVNAHVHDTELSSLRAFQTLEASKLLKDQGFAGYITTELLHDEGLMKMAKDDANFIKTMEISKFSNYLSKPSCADFDSKSDKLTKDTNFIKTMESSKFSILPKTGCIEADKSEHNALSSNIVKSTSSDTPLSTGTPVSSSELAAALLCASSTSLCNQVQGFRNRHRRIGIIEEADLSTPYNHYR